MFKYLFLVLALLISSDLLAFDYNKYLKSELRAKIKLQKLVDDAGDYKEALKFSKKALEKYSSSLMIKQYRAKALYLTKDLKNAKILFMHILEEDPTNDIAADFINKIEQQENAHKNKDLEEVIGYITGQGFDFLLIFLGFLGAEVLAKRYHACENNNYIDTIEYYINNYKYEEAGYKLNRFLYKTKKYLLNFFSICNLLSLIILFIISTSLTLIFFCVELIGHFDVILSEDILKSITTDELWRHFIITFVIISLAIVLNKVISSIREPKENENDVADTLQELVMSGEYAILRENISKLNATISKTKCNMIIEGCINNEAREVIQKLLIGREDNLL